MERQGAAARGVRLVNSVTSQRDQCGLRIAAPRMRRDARRSAAGRALAVHWLLRAIAPYCSDCTLATSQRVSAAWRACTRSQISRNGVGACAGDSRTMPENSTLALQCISDCS